VHFNLESNIGKQYLVPLPHQNYHQDVGSHVGKHNCLVENSEGRDESQYLQHLGLVQVAKSQMVGGGGGGKYWK
jgi:hypothetical protein